MKLLGSIVTNRSRCAVEMSGFCFPTELSSPILKLMVCVELVPVTQVVGFSDWQVASY